MKKLVSFLLVICLVMSVMPSLALTASAETSGTTGKCTWTLDNGVLTISGSGAMGDYSNYNKAPWGNEITKVNIEDGVTSIGDYAFYGCTGLESITIPDSVTSIEGFAFSVCAGLESITIPDSVTSIGNNAFVACTGLESITIPDSVTSIGQYAFAACTGLKSITIPNSVTSIGDDTFYNCTGLESVTIPDSVTSIGEMAFYDCTGLESITISDSVTSIEWGMFEDCAALKNITIPDSVTSIEATAFYGCTALESITIPDSVTSIEWGAFDGCTGLESITVPDSVTYIGEYAFPSSINVICSEDSYAFSYAQDNGLNVTVNEKASNYTGYTGDCTWTLDDNGVLTISGNGAMGDYDYGNGDAPWKYEYVREVILEMGVTSIGINAFYGMKSLEKITIPESVTVIKQGAFSLCTYLGPTTIPESVVEIVYNPFPQRDYNRNFCINCYRESTAHQMAMNYMLKYSVIQKESGQSSCEWSLNDGVLTISGTGNMENYEKYKAPWSYETFSKVVIEEGVTSIGDYSFFGCADNLDVSIPSTLTEIGYGAFGNDSIYGTAITITIPDSVTFIAQDAFLQGRTNFYCSKDSYAYSYATSKEMPVNGSGTTGDCVWSVKDDVLTISGSGRMKDYSSIDGNFGEIGYTYRSFEFAPWPTTIKKAVIEEGVTYIGKGAFFNCALLEEVEIPCGVEEIGYEAFLSCRSIENLVIPDGVTELGEMTFSDCYNLKNITIPESVTQIGEYLFENSNNVTVYCYEDSAAHIYAVDNDIPYVLLTPCEHEWNEEITVKSTEYFDGEKTCTCSKCGKVKTEVIPAILGDMTSDGVLNSADAIYLLRSIMNPRKYPISQGTDMNGDGAANSGDAIYLLRSIMNPRKYKLNYSVSVEEAYGVKVPKNFEMGNSDMEYTMKSGEDYVDVMFSNTYYYKHLEGDNYQRYFFYTGLDTKYAIDDGIYKLPNILDIASIRTIGMEKTGDVDTKTIPGMTLVEYEGYVEYDGYTEHCNYWVNEDMNLCIGGLGFIGVDSEEVEWGNGPTYFNDLGDDYVNSLFTRIDDIVNEALKNGNVITWDEFYNEYYDDYFDAE